MMSKTEKARQWFFQNIGFVVVALVGAAYIFKEFLQVSATGKTPLEILADSAIAMVVSYSIAVLLRYQGILTADKDERVVRTNELHGKTVQDLSEDLDKLEAYCMLRTNEELKKLRIAYLSTYGLRYKDYFDKEGNLRNDNTFVTPNSLSIDETKKIIKKALKIKITRLTTSALTTNYSNADDPLNMGVGKQQYMTNTARKSAFSKVLLGVGTGIIAIDMLANFSYANLIWAAIQLTTFLMIGTSGMIFSYFYIIDVDRSNVIRKIDELTKFKAWVKTPHAAEYIKKYNQEYLGIVEIEQKETNRIEDITNLLSNNGGSEDDRLLHKQETI